jgi:hypothetical protein
MTTVGQFNKVWMDFSRKCCTLFLTDEAKAEISPLFREFASEFEKQFGVDIQKSDTVPQDAEITGVALEKLRLYVERIDQSVSEDYRGWCGLRQLPNIC